MRDGFYRVDYSGRTNVGAGAFALVRGKIAGLDVGGVTYTGTYRPDGNDVVSKLRAKAPPSTAFVTGMNAGPTGMDFEVTLRVHSDGMLDIQSPIGAIQGRMTLISLL